MWTNRKVLIVGLAREGCAVAQFLAERGAKVTITDLKPAEALGTFLDILAPFDIRFCLGKHPTSLLSPDQTDFLVVSPGVPLTSAFLQKAQAEEFFLTTESRLFSQFCPAPITGISGSSGKTTTTTLVGLMLEASGYTTHVGGNIGQPLITKLDDIRPTDRVVMELSSFQLDYFHASGVSPKCLPTELRPLLAGWSPQVGALLNITPNHLDRHGTMAAYTRAKQALVGFMQAKQTAVLGLDNLVTRQMTQETSGTVCWFSLEQQVQSGACVVDDHIALIDNAEIIPICSVTALQLRGQHNVYNALAACAIAHEAGATIKAMQEVATSFTGVPHRLEKVAVRDGIIYINDSIATSPERLIAALKSFKAPIILLAGGKDKDLPWDEAAQLIKQRVRHLVLFGKAATLIDQALHTAAPNQKMVSVSRAQGLEQAVIQAQSIAHSGDIILLSPGCTSFDAYPDFVARGEHFKRLVQA